ncbi:MAG: hypothetical protein RL088_1243 [Verrucomicrobiota bacterium]|jgi:hypothetical protein
MKQTIFPIASPTSLLTEILRGHLLHRFRGMLPSSELNRAFEDARVIAEATGFPALVLPVLAEERLRHAVEEFRAGERGARAA